MKNTHKFFTIRNVAIHRTNSTGEGEGIFLDNVQNGQVQNVDISGFFYGLWLSLGSPNIITGNSMWNNTYGLYIVQGSNEIVSNNHLYNNSKYGVWIASSFNNVFSGNNVSSNGNGRCSPGCDGEGFVVSSSNNNLFYNNTAVANDWYGFRTIFSSGNVYRSNHVSRTQFGIILTQSTGNAVFQNNFTDNDFGIGLEGQDVNNNVTGNLITSTNPGSFAVYVTNGSRNTIYNNYLQALGNAYDDWNYSTGTAPNSWGVARRPGTNILGGPLVGGNFYSDYAGNDSDRDGIGDTAYPILGGVRGHEVQDYSPLVGTQPSGSVPVNVVVNPSFEEGVVPCLGAQNQLCPVSWDLSNCEGVGNATVAIDDSLQIDGGASVRVSTGPVTPTGCFPGNYANRAVGFSQFRQAFSGQGYNFTQLTDSPNGFSFWFQLQPMNGNGVAGFEVRIFGAESLAELDYVFDPDPSIGQFQNNTGTHSLLFYGYQLGIWYHFSRNLRADWMTSMGPANSALSLNYNFSLLQFQGFASASSGTLRSETFWLDDVRAYVGNGSIASGPSGGPNVLADPGFENPSSTAWSPLEYGNGSVRIHDISNPRTGTYSAMLNAINKTPQCPVAECKDAVRAQVQQNLGGSTVPTLDKLAPGNSFSAWWYVAPSTFPIYSLHIQVQFSDGKIIEYWYGLSDLANSSSISRVFNLGPIPSQGIWFEMQRNLAIDVQGLVASPSFTRVTAVWFGAFGGTDQGSPHGETAWLDDVSMSFLSIPDFRISVSPSILTVFLNGTIVPAANVTLMGLNGFSGSVDLSAHVDPGGLAVGLGGTASSSISLVLDSNRQNSTALMPLILSSSQPGSYLVTVIGTSGLLSHATNMTIVLMRPDIPPIANFTISPARLVSGRQVQFDGSASYDPDGYIVNWQWSFGDGFSGSFGSYAYHAYNSPGTYNVTLTVQDNGGLRSSSSMVLVVSPSPEHDVGIVYVQAYPQRAVSSQIVSISVALANNGNSTEMVDVTAYYGGHVAGSITGIRLFPSPYNYYYSIQWDTLGVSPGNYTISATVFLATDEHPADNTLSNGFVIILSAPTLTLTPPMGSQGAQVTVQGDGFPANYGYGTQVLVTFDDQFVGFGTSINGHFTFVFNVPLAQAGAHTVKALDGTGARALGSFTITQSVSSSRISVSITGGTLYFPGDKAVIYVQTSVNGQPASVSSLQIVLVRPIGPNVTLTAVLVSPGEWRVTYTVPSTGGIGTYAVVATAHQSGVLDGFALSGFVVKPTWLQSHGTAVVGVTAAFSIVAGLGVAWRKGYFARRKEDFSVL